MNKNATTTLRPKEKAPVDESRDAASRQDSARTEKIDQFLTLDSIPPETFEYRLGNRSALELVIDQYQVNTDKRSGISNDPNHPEDPEYIVRLLGQVIRVSLEKVKMVKTFAAAGEVRRTWRIRLI